MILSRLPADATRRGVVEIPGKGEVYANFLKENSGRFDGVILCLPNLGDETGAAMPDMAVVSIKQLLHHDLARKMPP